MQACNEWLIESYLQIMAFVIFLRHPCEFKKLAGQFKIDRLTLEMCGSSCNWLTHLIRFESRKYQSNAFAIYGLEVYGRCHLIVFKSTVMSIHFTIVVL